MDEMLRDQNLIFAFAWFSESPNWLIALTNKHLTHCKITIYVAQAHHFIFQRVLMPQSAVGVRVTPRRLQYVSSKK